MSDTPPPRHAPRALWLIAQAFMQALYALFGNPEDIAQAPHRQARAYKQLATWIAAGEALLRRLLMIEAAATTPAPPRRPRAKRAARVRTRIACFPDQPQAWRVSFRAVPSQHRPLRLWRPKKRLFTPRHIVDAWPLALRYEALIRVCNNPGPYAARLARHLRAAPRRARAILRASAAITATVGRDALHELTKAAKSAWRPPPRPVLDSS